MSKTRIKKSYGDLLLDLIEQYREEHQNKPFNMDDLADWAFETGGHDIVRLSAKRELKRNLTKAARKKKTRDTQGRLVREFHAAKYPRVDENGNMILEAVWDHINAMSFDHAALSFIDGRRGQLSGGCKSLKADIDSFNDNNPNATQDKIQISFDFTFDVEDDEADETDTSSDIAKRRPR